MHKASTCGRVQAPGPTPSAHKQWRSVVHVKITSLSARDRHWLKSRERERIYSQHSNIKARVSVFWRVSATQNGEGWLSLTHHCIKFKSIKTFLILKLISITKLLRVVAPFPQASQSWPAETAADSEFESETPCVCACPCACPSNPSKQCLSAAQRAWPLILQSKTSNVFWNGLARWPAGTWTWTQTWTLPGVCQCSLANEL